MDRLLRGPLRRLDVQVALGSMVVVLLVGIAVIIQVDALLERNEEERYRQDIARASEQLLDQIAIFQDLLLIAAVWIASLDEVAGTVEAGEIDAALRAINAAFAPFGFTADRPPTLHLFAPDGRLLASTFPSDEAAGAPPVVVEVIESGRPMRSARLVEGLGPAIVAAAPVYDGDRRLIAVLEGIAVIDDEIASDYAALLGFHVAATYQGRPVASSDPGGFQPGGDRGLPPGSVDYVALDGGRYLAGRATLAAHDDSPVVDFHVGVSEAEVRAGIAGMRSTVIPVFGAGALLAVFLSFGVAWLTSRHMGGLSAAARRIQRNDLDEPVPVRGGGEIRALAIAMEEMRVAIRRSQEALAASNSDLSLRVDTSTANLAEVSHELSAMHNVLAQLDGEPPGGLPGVAEALAELAWADGTIIAMVEESGRLAPAAIAGVSLAAAAALVEAVNGGAPGDGIDEDLYLPDAARDGRFARLVPLGIGGLALQAMLTPDGVAGFVALVTERHLTLTPQREDLLRSVAREVALTLERTELAGEVEENRRIAESVLREMSDGVLVLDHQQLCRIANPAAARLLGRARADIVGKPASAYLPVGHRALEALRRRHTTDSDTGPIVVELDGRQVAVAVKPFADPDPDRAGLIVMLRDLSSEAEAERVKQDFVSMVGHELRTPLTLIRTTIDLLHEQDAGALNDTQQRIVGVLRNNSERLMSLISDLLDMSALDAGRMHIAPDWTDLGAAVTSAAESLRDAAQTKQHSLTVKAPAGLTVWADRARVEQVVANLVGNAIKYTPPGGEIVVSAVGAGDMAEVSVSDDGMGIAPEEQAHLFEKFYRTVAGQRTTGGTGLGLAIARSLVELHGGTIRVQSDGETGSTFTFTLPRQRL